MGDLKLGEVVVSDGVSVQTAPTAPHSFSRPAETCQEDQSQTQGLSPTGIKEPERTRQTQASYSVQAIGVKGFTSQSQDLRLGIVVTSQLVRWTDIVGIIIAPLKPSPKRMT